MNGVKVLIGAMAVMILLAGCATPQTQASRKDYEALCTALDKERKGQVSEKDFITGAKDKQEAARLFQLCDTNRDQFLSYNEYLANKSAIDKMMQLTPPPPVR
jgi:Ca2+-binding EF-hand superfamily protein